MSLYLEGKQANLSRIWAGGEVDAIYVGDEMVWPDITGYSGGIFVELPTQGTLDWLYWQHVLFCIDTMEINQKCYAKFVVNGVEYYLNKGPRGKQVVTLDGNIILLNAKQQAQLAGKVGSTISLQVAIPERASDWRDYTSENNPQARYEHRWTLPLLPATKMRAQVTGGRKKEDAYFNFYTLTSLPSGSEINIEAHFNRHGRYTWTEDTRALTADELGLSDYNFTLKYVVYGAICNGQGVTPVWPAFRRVFNLNVLSEF